MSVGKINVTSTLRRAERLLQEDKSASPALRAIVEVLITVIQLLVQKLGANSTNSSLPPSQDPHRRRGSKRKGSARKRRPGGQPGHEGATLQPDPHPDQIETIAIDRRPATRRGRSSTSRSTST
jgi:transposase